MKAIRVHTPGGPEAMKFEEIPDPVPGPGQVVVQIEAAGVNFVDIYNRSGLYKNPVPFQLGQEASGIVELTSPDVHEVKRGDRVAYQGVAGAYAEYAAVPAMRVVKVPDGLSTRTAAAALLQGMTAHYLSHSTYALKPGDITLVHAAAGGVGLLLVQMAKRRGARVLGTVSSDEKAKLAMAAGADEVIVYSRTDFEAEVKRLTGGRGVNVVYDAVGKDTFERSLNCLAPRGVLVLYGQASGPVPPFDLRELQAKGSLYVTRPGLAHYTLTRHELLQRAGEVFDWIKAGELDVRIDREFPLKEAAEAHRRLQGRESSGKLLLIP